MKVPVMFKRFVIVIGCLLTLTAPAAAAPSKDHARDMAAGMKLFAEHVRPILLQNCFECHGGRKIKSELDMIERRGLLQGGEHGPVVVPGDAEASLLYRFVAHLEKPHMPYRRDRLPDEAIEKIKQWINLGAPYDKPLGDVNNRDLQQPGEVTDLDREYWAFAPLTNTLPPQVKNDAWSRTPIDHFILKKLRDEKLKPNPIADRRTLIRRAYFDLIGLPPTPEEVEAFVNDPDPDAYEKLIDRLLDKPGYGERWARHFFDVARFAESAGYEQDYHRPHAYHYRDFVIRALNQDMPYDRFASWQIAGDELAPENPLAMMATGFLGAGAFPTQLTEKEFESARYTELDDMAQAVGASFLGLTIGCARCHDHKYDPIPDEDYYDFVANFTTAIRSDVKLNMMSPAEKKAFAEKRKQRITDARAALTVYEQDEQPRRFITWLEKQRQSPDALSPWTRLDVADIQTAHNTKFEKQPDGSLLAAGGTPAKDVYTLTTKTNATNITALRLEALAHPSLPRNGPGLASNGNFALGDITVTIAPADAPDKAQPVKLIAARATHQQNTSSLSVAASIDDDKVSGWAVDSGGIGKDQAAVFDFEKPVGRAGGSILTVTLRFEHPNTKHAMGRPRLSITTRPKPKPEVGYPGPPADIAALVRSDKLTDEQTATLRDYFNTVDPQHRKLTAALDEASKAQPDGVKQKVMIVSENVKPRKHHADGRGFPHFYPTTYRLNRGDVNQKLEPAEPGYLQVLMRGGKTDDYWKIEPPKDATTSYRRASLANWLTDEQFGAGHLMARVVVNRLWHHHLGRGIVATPIDFGHQSPVPSHPELLDWLANNLIENGWTLKRIHKLIMTSSVYMQNADADKAREKIDPENHLLWRWTPRRLEAEPIRDAMLAVSGRLDRRMFGPGTLNESMNRRSVYFQIKRSQLIPMMMLFDWPEHLVPIGSRNVTTIAPQALALMNNPQVRDYARAFAQRIAGSDDPITTAYRLALGRAPTPDEHTQAEQFIARQTQSYRATGHAQPEQAARIDFCQAVFAFNEFVYIN